MEMISDENRSVIKSNFRQQLKTIAELLIYKVNTAVKKVRNSTRFI